MKGLNNAEVIENRKKYGTNKLPEPKSKTWIDFTKEMIKEPITALLIGITVIEFLMSFFGVYETSEIIVMFGLILVIISLGVSINMLSQKYDNELRKKISTVYCNVIRNSVLTTINKDDIVVGDIVQLENGKNIYADGYVISGKVNVSNMAINGESRECKKTPVEEYLPPDKFTTDDYDNQNCVFAGTTVMSGEGYMKVVKVGMDTVNGKTLTDMQNVENPETNLNMQLKKLVSFITKWGTIAAFTTFVIAIASGCLRLGINGFFHDTALENVKLIATNIGLAFSIIVAAVPEGLGLIIKLVTMLNVKIMKKFNILGKNPNKIPELANTNLICTDKTGTLTTGVMSPREFIDGDSQIIHLDSLASRVRENIVLNNSAQYDVNSEITGGNSIDRAILSLISKEAADRILTKNKILERQVFKSENKFSALSIKNQEVVISYYKGATERIIDKCSFYETSNGELKKLTSIEREKIYKKVENMTTSSMRCVAFAYNNRIIEEDVLPNELILQGVMGVNDPVRKEVPDAVETVKKAGIKVIEITGDCYETAIAVAKEARIYNGEEDVALTDKEFREMSDEQVKEVIPKLSVIARCSPSTKLRLVTLAQEIGYSVAVTGDGTNDSPALKKADVGFAMNSGTDVAKAAGDIILTDNNFSSVAKSIELGRTFMHNILMFLDFQLPINMCLLIMNFLYPIFYVGSLIASTHVLLINIIMDTLNSLAFGGEPPKDEYMKEIPIKRGDGLFTRDSKQRIIFSTCTFICAYGILLLTPLKEYFPTEEVSMTSRFALLCLISIFNGFNIRTDRINLFKGLNKNVSFGIIAAGIISGTVIIIQFLGKYFVTTPMNMTQWGIVLLLSLIIIPIDIGRKILMKGGKIK